MMIHLPLILLCSASSTSALPPSVVYLEDVDDEITAEDVLRVYEVSSLLVLEEKEHTESFLPTLVPFGVDENLTQFEEGDYSGDTILLSLLEELFYDDFNYEGRQMMVMDNHRLFLRGPEELHRRVTATLEFFGDVINSQAVFTLDVLEGVERGTQGLPSVMDYDAVEQLLAQRPGTHRESHLLVVRPNRTARVDQVDKRSFLMDYDVEIAQGAAIMDPIQGQVINGSSFSLRAAPAEGGLYVALMAQRNNLLDGMEPVDLETKFFINSEPDGATFVDHASQVQMPRVATSVLSLSGFMPSGKALVFQTAASTEEGELSQVLILRHTAGQLPGRFELPLAKGGGRLIFADMGAIDPPRARSSGTALGPIPRSGMGLSRDLNSVLSSTLVGGSSQLMMQWNTTELTQVDSVGRWLVSRPQPYSKPEGEATLEQEAFVELLNSLRPTPDPLQVDVVVRSGSGFPIRARFPMRCDTSAVVLLGVEGRFLFDHDVEVAQGVSTPNPRVLPSFDGLCLWLKPSRMAGGGLQLQLRGSVELERSAEVVAIRCPTFGHLDQRVSRQLLFDERLRPDQIGPVWSAVVGEVESAAGVSVHVEIREL